MEVEDGGWIPEAGGAVDFGTTIYRGVNRSLQVLSVILRCYCKPRGIIQEEGAKKERGEIY